MHCFQHYSKCQDLQCTFHMPLFSNTKFWHKVPCIFSLFLPLALMRVKDMNWDLKGQYVEKVLKFTIHYFFLLHLASFSLTFNFLFYQNMKEFLLTRKSLNIVRISTTLFVRVEEDEWTGVLKKKIENFENVLKRILKRVLSEDVKWRKKL